MLKFILQVMSTKIVVFTIWLLTNFSILVSSKFQKTKYDLYYLSTISNVKNKLLIIIEC